MNIADPQIEHVLDEFLDDISLTAQATDIISNKALIGKELLDSDKKRWALFRVATSVLLFFVTSVGYLYYSDLHKDVHATTVKTAVLEENAKDYVTKKDFIEAIEKRFAYLEAQQKSAVSHKDLLEAKEEIMKLLLRLHLPQNKEVEKKEEKR
jgi:hypothetical protein